MISINGTTLEINNEISDAIIDLKYVTIISLGSCQTVNIDNFQYTLFTTSECIEMGWKTADIKSKSIFNEMKQAFIAAKKIRK